MTLPNPHAEQRIKELRESIADVRAALTRAVERVTGISTPAMQGDNLAILICGHFENPDQPNEEDGWTADASTGYDEVKRAIDEHFSGVFQSLNALPALIDHLEADGGEEASLALQEATSLAKSLFTQHYRFHDEHYASGRIKWEPLPDLRGVISQIDNMTCGLMRKPEEALPAPSVATITRRRVEPVAIEIEADDLCDDCPPVGYPTDKTRCTPCPRRVATGEGDDFQARVAAWMQECFGPTISADKLERNDRFIEESLELVQSLGYTADRAHALVDYVFGRPIGEPHQEVGGVGVTLAALCIPSDLDMAGAFQCELDRITQPEVIAKIRAKQAAKPTGSALPIAKAPSHAS